MQEKDIYFKDEIKFGIYKERQQLFILKRLTML